MALLCIEGLACHVDGKRILQDVELELREREIHVLLGPNGSGKTTLARVIMGCAGYAATEGRLRFAEQDLTDLALHERARLGITMAWQEPARFEGLKVSEYLRLGAKERTPAECLRHVGLDPESFLSRALDKTLSGGERKRIELAAIYAMQPRLALLDEPAAGIDMPSLEEIERLILDLRRSGGAVLLITHAAILAGLADRGSYLRGGRIVYTGAATEAAARYQAR